ARYIGKKYSSIDDFVDGLIKGNALPLVLAALAGTLQHLRDPVGVIGSLVTGLPLRTDAAVNLGGPLKVLFHVKVGMEGERVVGAAVHLDRHAVHDLDLDAAAGVAVQADCVKGVLG